MPPGRKPAGRVVIVPGPACSDGDPSHKPTLSSYSKANPESWLQKVGAKWMEQEGGGVAGGTIYQLNQFPQGYVLWERTRASGSHIDRFLYGHPEHKIFDSPYRFYPHFKYLMQRRNGVKCQCDICEKTKGSVKGSISKLTNPRGRLPLHQLRTMLQKGPVDEELTPDIYRSLFTLLKTEGTLTRKIEEPSSMDWRSEKRLVDEIRRKISKEYSFLPRTGEVVLWRRSQSTTWLGGIITQVPEEESFFQDITQETPKQFAVNRSGFRVECLPNPNDEDKHFSRQYSYVPLSAIRPFMLWRTVLKDTPEDKWHPSVRNMLTSCASVSLIDRYQFDGVWPRAYIYSHGLFFGAESYFVGDIIRLVPEPNSEVSDIMKITKIVTTFANLETERDNITVTGNRCGSIAISVFGPVYTCDSRKSNSKLTVEFDDPSLPMHRYNCKFPWFYRGGKSDIYEVEFPRILSRLYELKAVMSWVPNICNMSGLVDAGAQDIRMAREFAAKNDNRLVETGKKFFWGEYRAECLDLSTLAGLEVGNYASERQPKLWREVLHLLDGKTEAELGTGGRPLQHGESKGFTPVNQRGTGTSKPTQLAHGQDDDEADDSDEVEKIVDEEDYRTVEPTWGRTPEKKKARLEVAIPLKN
ncbi:MAG: hypothetical protein Q9167_004708 [Letrouitia subvulpina]